MFPQSYINFVPSKVTFVSSKLRLKLRMFSQSYINFVPSKLRLLPPKLRLFPPKLRLFPQSFLCSLILKVTFVPPKLSLFPHPQSYLCSLKVTYVPSKLQDTWCFTTSQPRRAIISGRNKMCSCQCHKHHFWFTTYYTFHRWGLREIWDAIKLMSREGTKLGR